MLRMWVNHVIDDERIVRLPERMFVKHLYKREWSTGKWTNYITTTVDKTPLVKDFCFESPIFGQIAPESLSTGSIALIIMAHEPDTIMPLCWLGDNCISVLAEMCKELDCTISHGGVFYNFDDFDKVKIMETGDIIPGAEVTRYISFNRELDEKASKGMIIAPEILEIL